MNIVKFFEKSEIRFVEHPEGKYGFGIVADDLALVLEASSGKDISRSVSEKWKGVHSTESLEKNKIILNDVNTPSEISVSKECLRNEISVSKDNASNEILLSTYNASNEISWEKIVIWEPGIYQLLAVSRKPKAKIFQDWLFEDVLPSIRKTGSYHLDKERAELKQLQASLEKDRDNLKQLTASLESERDELAQKEYFVMAEMRSLDDRIKTIKMAQIKYLRSDSIRKVGDNPMSEDDQKAEDDLRAKFPRHFVAKRTEAKRKILQLAHKSGSVSVNDCAEYDLGVPFDQFPEIFKELAEDYCGEVEGTGINLIYHSQRTLVEAISVAMKAYR